jgi:hypothetical protein
MNLVLKIFIIIIYSFLLNGCGGQKQAANPAAAPAEAVEATPAKKANNPLASQQQLIRDAKAIQGILDKDAEEKKKALENSN